MSIRDHYNKTFIHKRQTVSRDSQGGAAKEWSTLGSFRGRAKPATARERLSASQYGAEISHVIFCDSWEDVRRGDRLESGDLVLAAIDVRDPGGLGHHLEVDAEAEQHGV